VMCFAFTDARIAAALVALCRDVPALTLRIVADWSQSARGAPTVLEQMAAAGLRNLFIKFKLDAPYARDDTGRLRYSYGASWGMLHHKTLLIRLDGGPALMALGSYNWTARGQQAYENLIVSDDPALLAAFADEFAALWADHRLTGTTDRARHVMARLKAEAALGRDLRDPVLLADVLGVEREMAAPPSARRLEDGPVIAAFSGSRPPGGEARAGHAAANDRRALNLLRPAGARRPAPLTLNTLALEAIRGVPSGARLRVAMYALSARVPEFGALIDAARRGVQVDFILDGTIGARCAAAIAGFATRESLPLRVQTTRRRMHQKYLCCPDTGMVLSGTANMTEDATDRHSDHRILWRDAPALAAAFAADFDTISARLAPADQRAA
jgi:phosphatidylserine/phosphatidylglycerophosphate/cardiolipin synthase-like enzyme